MPFIYKSKRPIYYRVWDNERPKANIVFLHGIGEHSGLYHRFAYAQNSQGYRVWAIDHTGHGHTSGRLDEAYDVFGLAKNAIQLLEIVQSQDNLPIVLIGHSLGGVTASLLVSEEKSLSIQGLVLTGTPLDPIPELVDIDSIDMSLDPGYLDELSVDPLIPREEIDFSQLNKGLARAQDVISSKIDTWPFPVLFLNGEVDPIAPPTRARKWARRVLSGHAIEIRDGHHDLINDLCHARVSQLVSSFVYEVTSKEIIKH
ncbi:alpha/beta hydrolase [Peribacillus simplex]|uniref:alpha/beta hydrolase n=1 Tax=Peribacillus simplex TaxID=1478 RepID=UPI00366BD862